MGTLDPVPEAVEEPAVAADAALTRRRLPYLVTGQMLGGVGVASGVAVGGLLAEQVSGSESMAGLAQTASVLGGGLIAVPMALLAERRGRAPALAAGYAVALTGAVVVLLGAAVGALAPVLAGMALFGAGSAVGLQARYAAIDCADAQRRGRVLSTVVWATTIGAVLGPNLSVAGGDLGDAAGVPRLAGPFLISVIAFALAAATCLSLPEGRRPAGHPGVAGDRGGSTLRVIARRPAALAGLVTMACGHATMVGVMVMTPVHLGHDGAALRVIGLVISLHIAGMYALSPVMGWLTDRFGSPATILVGVALLLAALLTAASAGPHAHGRVAAALVLLGLGWSASMVAGSALLSAAVPIAVRTRAQGTGDLVVGLSAAVAAASSGPILAASDYATLALSQTVLLLPMTALVIWARLTRRADPAG